MSLLRHALAALALAALVPAPGEALSGEPPPERELVVLAAASLRDAFTPLARSFEASHPGVQVSLDFAGSQQLRAQIEHGAAADVFASADAPPMKALADAGLCRAPLVFARNVPVLVVPRGNPAGVATFEELAKAKRVVVGVPESPIGAYTVRILERAEKARPGFRAAVEARIASRELNVRQVLAKVALGEAEAGVVYRTDALSARDRVSVVEIPPAFNEVAGYQVARLARSKEAALAQEFIALLTGPEGRRALEAQGFMAGPPAAGEAAKP
jgi:molybdate transport system substrate-binding protein